MNDKKGIKKGYLVVVSHWGDFKLEDATTLGIFDKEKNGYFYIKNSERGYRYLRRVITDKFHIIPKSDPPEKHVSLIWVDQLKNDGRMEHFGIKLKWRGEK